MNLAAFARLKLILIIAGVCLAVSLCPATAAPYKSNQISHRIRSAEESSASAYL